MAIECTILTGPQDLKLSEGAYEFLVEVRSRLECKLPGVFLLYDWGVDKIEYRTKTKEALITQLCQEIQRIAPTLAEGEEAQLCQPFPVKLRKEPWEVTGNCDLLWDPPGGVFIVDPKDTKIREQFEEFLNEANEKFADYTHMPTIFLVNICETGLKYEMFKDNLFQSVDMQKYPNVRHIYLSEGAPDPIIYPLWSYSTQKGL